MFLPGCPGEVEEWSGRPDFFSDVGEALVFAWDDEGREYGRFMVEDGAGVALPNDE